MKIERFEDIQSWQRARGLVKKIYALSSNVGLSKDFGLKDQLQRAALSIMNNIAEGFDAGTSKGFIRFLQYAYRSASEVQSMLYVCLDLGYIETKSFHQLYTETQEIKKLIGGLIKYLKSKP